MKFLKYFIILLSSFYNYLFHYWLMFVPFHAIRLFLIKLRVSKLGYGCSFLMGTEIRNGDNISIGSNCVFNRKVLLDGRGGKIRIGNNVDIAQETNIWTLQHDVHDNYHRSVGADVTIEDYVWIASRVTILPGVKIGRGSVIATNSVVTKDIPEMSIAAGIPAKIISERKSSLLYILSYKPWFE